MIARTTWGRALAVWMSFAVAQLAGPAAQAAPAPGSTHVVDSGEVARRLIQSATTRGERVKLFQDALATPEARERARSMGADPDRLRAAVPHLSDRELADLAGRAQVQDLAAGHRRGGGGDGALVLVGVLLLLAGIVVIAAAADGYDDYDEYWDDCWCY